MSGSVEVRQRPRLARHAFGSMLARSWFPAGVVGIALAAFGFFLVNLEASPPHEDEALALFVGRGSLPGVVHHVTHVRGGAPLHFILAWAVAHLGFGLAGLRLVSALLAAASLVLGALLCEQLSDRRTAILGTALAAASWVFLFHGVFGRMYSLFLLTSIVAALALLRALERGRTVDWALWVLAILTCVASHPYGSLVLAGHGLFVVLNREHVRAGLAACAVAVAAGTPFWLTDRRLAHRFDVEVGGGGAQLGGPRQVAGFLWSTAGDFTAGWSGVLIATTALAGLGLLVVRRRGALLTGCLLAAPVAAFLAARLHTAASPQTRHLIFLLPFFTMLVAAGMLRIMRRCHLVVVVAIAVTLLSTEVAWAWHRTPQLITREPATRVAARAAAAAWLAETTRPTDLLLGYDPVFLAAWERNRSFSRLVVPRADVTLMLGALQRDLPLGRGVFVLDGSDPRNRTPTMSIPLATPQPAGDFEVRRFGPYLVIRTRRPTGSVVRYLSLAERVERVGLSLGLDDATVNHDVIAAAQRRLS
jgi:hypothetical protein